MTAGLAAGLTLGLAAEHSQASPGSAADALLGASASLSRTMPLCHICSPPGRSRTLSASPTARPAARGAVHRQRILLGIRWFNSNE